MVRNILEELVELQIQPFGQYTSVPNKSVHERQELVRETHKEEWLRAEPLRVNNQGCNLVGQH